MLGRVYTFEQEGEALDLRTGRWASTDSVHAILAAAEGIAGVHYEQLTGAQNPKPVVAVLFTDRSALEVFSKRFDAALKAHRLKLSGVSVIKG
jgi:hypothetical protein